MELKFNEQGLIPAIAQDCKTKEVLMLAYMNQEAFDLTVKTGKATYFSRSRQSLWVKGETSGHFQYVKEIRYDCDCDTVLLLIEQVGAACHTGNYSCFYRKVESFKPENN
ncbi:MAG: phosphoribosyl-AMP cyclohydrolase [Firmicutes bacterium]|nr:phosphoribosyl-AMP cyclohydrolase [Bacillota bacterium]